MKGKIKEWGISFALRGILGVLLIHFLNVCFMKYGYQTIIGINEYTVPIVAVLGVPGIGLLYGLAFFWG